MVSIIAKCKHCNSEITKYEQHFPITKENKGKEIKYCEIRISRSKLRDYRNL